MPLNDTAMVQQAGLLQELLLYAQLHDDFAGVDGEDNIAVAGRVAIIWDTPDSSGNFGIPSAIDFTGGTPGSAVHSITLWDEETDGICYGEVELSGDATFNASGDYSVTVIDVTGTAS